MTKAKGLAALGITAALTVACMLPTLAASSPPEPDAPEVRETILQLLEQRALHRDQIDWPAARHQLKRASTTAEADKILDQLIARSTANHGRWIRASATSRSSSSMQRWACPTSARDA